MRHEVLHDSADEYSWDVESIHDIRYGAYRRADETEGFLERYRSHVARNCYRRVNENDEESRLDLDKETLDPCQELSEYD